MKDDPAAASKRSPSVSALPPLPAAYWELTQSYTAEQMRAYAIEYAAQVAKTQGPNDPSL